MLSFLRLEWRNYHHLRNLLACPTCMMLLGWCSNPHRRGLKANSTLFWLISMKWSLICYNISFSTRSCFICWLRAKHTHNRHRKMRIKIFRQGNFDSSVLKILCCLDTVLSSVCCSSPQRTQWITIFLILFVCCFSPSLFVVSPSSVAVDFVFLLMEE